MSLKLQFFFQVSLVRTILIFQFLYDSKRLSVCGIVQRIGPFDPQNNAFLCEITDCSVDENCTDDFCLGDESPLELRLYTSKKLPSVQVFIATELMPLSIRQDDVVFLYNCKVFSETDIARNKVLIIVLVFRV